MELSFRAKPAALGILEEARTIYRLYVSVVDGMKMVRARATHTGNIMSFGQGGPCMRYYRRECIPQGQRIRITGLVLREIQSLVDDQCLIELILIVITDEEPDIEDRERGAQDPSAVLWWTLHSWVVPRALSEAFCGLAVILVHHVTLE